MKKKIVKSKAKTKAKAKAKKAPAKRKPTPKTIRRPAINDAISMSTITEFTQTIDGLKNELEQYAANMRALDRRRLNAVGPKKLGFIELAYNLASKNSEFLPYWITREKFRGDIEYMKALQNALNINKQITELLTNLDMQASDMAYTDALEYYAYVREAAKRRIDAAETIFEEMRTYFRSRGKRGEDAPTEAEIERDVKAILHGRKDGKILLENTSPKIIKGKKKFLDETYKGKAAFKKIDNEEID